MRILNDIVEVITGAPRLCSIIFLTVFLVTWSIYRIIYKEEIDKIRIMEQKIALKEKEIERLELEIHCLEILRYRYIVSLSPKNK